MEQKKKHLHTGHRQRLKKKAVNGGIEHWPEHEILELILTYAIPQKDVNPLAHGLIDQFGSISGVLDAGYRQLIKVKGIGESAATLLSLLPDIFSKYNESKHSESTILDTTRKCVDYFKSINRVKEHEQFYVFCLNAKKKLIKTTHINSTFKSSVTFSVTEFIEIITSCSTKAIVVLHTHPSGDSNPTQADIYATKQLMNICNTLGIVFDDHIIIADSEYYSFSHSGLRDSIKAHLKYGTPLP